ncbi:hypothetical protein WMY93_000504 [Mugilogobius chulae]|uniref:Uncharacterized protein n=1 Tax=Mugilogobius chulae TaxID=88201 RepID=A0AAW0PZ46_9GOBI
MSTSVFRRNSCRGGSCGARTSAEGPRRRSSSCFPPGAAEDFSVSLNQPIVSIALRFLLAIDLWLSKRLGVCSCEEAAWGSIRPLVRLVEFSGHAAPWLCGAVYTLLRVDTAEEQEIMLNLTLGPSRETKSRRGTNWNCVREEENRENDAVNDDARAREWCRKLELSEL